MPYLLFYAFFWGGGGRTERTVDYFSAKYFVSLWNEWTSVCFSISGFWAIFILILRKQTEPESSIVSLLNI